LNYLTLKEHLLELSRVYPLKLDDRLRWFIIQRFSLPPGYTWTETDVLVDIPSDYPESPPGVGNSRVYLPQGLRYCTRKPRDYHEWTGPQGWAWWCYEWILWDSRKDNLITFTELFRTHMTNPP